MAKQKHDIGYQKRIRREEFTLAKPRRTKPKPQGISRRLRELLNLHSIEDHHVDLMDGTQGGGPHGR